MSSKTDKTTKQRSGPWPSSPPRVAPVLLATDLVALSAIGPRSVGWIITVVVYVLLAGAAGFYRSRLNLLLLDDLPGLLGRLFAASAAGTMVQQALQSRIESAWWYHLMIGAGLLAAGRAVVYAGVRLARSRRFVNHPTLIVGLGDTGQRLANALLDRTDEARCLVVTRCFVPSRLFCFVPSRQCGPHVAEVRRLSHNRFTEESIAACRLAS